MQKWKVYRHKRRRLIMYVSENYIDTLTEVDLGNNVVTNVSTDATEGSFPKIARLLAKNYKTLSVGVIASLTITAANNLYAQYKATDPKMAATKAQRFVNSVRSRCSISKDPRQCKARLYNLSKRWDDKLMKVSGK